MNRHSIELQSLANRDYPPPPAGATMREWFAGLVLGNPDLMKDVSPPNRAAEAVRLADELIQALSAPRSPSRESLQPPSASQMEAWDAVTEDAAARSRVTSRMLRPVRSPTPPPVRRQTGEHFAAATQILRSVDDSPSPPKPCGSYSVINPDD